jgi:hypothetical protein
MNPSKPSIPLVPFQDPSMMVSATASPNEVRMGMSPRGREIVDAMVRNLNRNVAGRVVHKRDT